MILLVMGIGVTCECNGQAERGQSPCADASADAFVCRRCLVWVCRVPAPLLLRLSAVQAAALTACGPGPAMRTQGTPATSSPPCTSSTACATSGERASKPRCRRPPSFGLVPRRRSPPSTFLRLLLTQPLPELFFPPPQVPRPGPCHWRQVDGLDHRLLPAGGIAGQQHHPGHRGRSARQACMHAPPYTVQCGMLMGVPCRRQATASQRPAVEHQPHRLPCRSSYCSYCARFAVASHPHPPPRAPTGTVMKTLNLSFYPDSTMTLQEWIIIFGAIQLVLSQVGALSFSSAHTCERTLELASSVEPSAGQPCTPIPSSPPPMHPLCSSPQSTTCASSTWSALSAPSALPSPPPRSPSTTVRRSHTLADWFGREGQLRRPGPLAS